MNGYGKDYVQQNESKEKVQTQNDGTFLWDFLKSMKTIPKDNEMKKRVRKIGPWQEACL